MYFEINLQDVTTDSGRTFIKSLSDLLERLNPNSVDISRITVRCKVVSGEEYICVYIPHKTKSILDLLIEHGEVDSSVKLAHANFNFQEYRNNKRINDVINLISKIMQTTIEIQTYYKGKKLVMIKPYFITRNGKKEPFQLSLHNCTSLINPFLKMKKAVQQGSFYKI